MTTVGEVAAAQAAAYHPDLCFMGVYAIHPEYGMTIPYPEEVSIKRQLIHSSSRVIALVNPHQTEHCFNDTRCVGSRIYNSHHRWKCAAGDGITI